MRKDCLVLAVESDDKDTGMDGALANGVGGVLEDNRLGKVVLDSCKTKTGQIDKGVMKLLQLEQVLLKGECLERRVHVSGDCLVLRRSTGKPGKLGQPAKT